MTEVVAIDRNRSFLELASDADYWRELNPDFAITDKGGCPTTAPCELPESGLANIIKDVKEQGFFTIDRALDQTEIDRMARLVKRLVEMDWPAPFAAVYDDFWKIIQRCSGVSEHILGSGYKLMPNFWVFHIPPDRSGSGWSPHRDRPQTYTLSNDKTPITLRLWIPLTDATTGNSCMYFLPTNLDPDYPHNLFSDKVQNLQHARCVPAPAGSILGWNEHVLHWGSSCGEGNEQPRISLAFTLQANVPPFESPLLDPSVLPTFSQRLGLIGQMIRRFESREARAMTQNSWKLANKLSDQVEVTQCQCAFCVSKLEMALEADMGRKPPNFQRALIEAVKLADSVMQERGSGNINKANRLATLALNMIGLSEEVDFVETIESHLLFSDTPASGTEHSHPASPALQSAAGHGPEARSLSPVEPDAELEQILTILVRALGAQHQRVKDTLLRLIERGGTWPTNYLHRLGPVYRQLLTVRELELGPTHCEIADRLIQYATYLESNGLYIQSKPCLERAVSIRRDAAGSNKAAQLAYAQSLSRLGAVLINLTETKAAEPKLREALAIVDKLDWRGIVTVRVLHDLGCTLMWSNRVESETCLRRAIELGRSSPVLGTLLRDTAYKLADIYLFWGRIADAIPLLEHHRYPDTCALVLPQSNEGCARQNDEITRTSNPYADVLRELSKKFNPPELYRFTRQSLVRKYAWAIPNEEALSTIAKFGPLVEIGAGAGYWAAMLRARGVDIVAYDSAPMETGDNKYTNNGRGWTEVQRGDEAVAGNYPDRALMLCWPPRMEPMAMNAINAYTGKRLIYIGEGPQGMTADQNFHDALEREWRLIKTIEIDRWHCSTDSLKVYERKKK